MAPLPQFAKDLQVPVQELVKVSEAMVLNPESELFNAISCALGERIRGVSHPAQKGSKVKPRVYVPWVLNSVEKFSVQSSFPNLVPTFLDKDILSAALFRSVRLMAQETMLGRTTTGDGRAVGFGLELMPMLMRSRWWMHLCVPGLLPYAQFSFVKEDEQVDAVVASLVGRNATVPKTMRKYITEPQSMHCTRADVCTKKANVVVADLSHADVPFRQFAYWMKTHDAKMGRFIVPSNKHMELGSDGPFPEIGAHVIHRDGRVILVFEKDISEQCNFAYENYLELIARSRCEIDGETYHKEFVGRVLGMAEYKVTRIPRVFEEPPLAYKSWVYPEYRGMYMIHYPILKPGKAPNLASSWGIGTMTLPKPTVDDVVEYAMNIDDKKDLAKLIERRLNGKVSNYLMTTSFVRSSENMDPVMFASLALVIYTKVFMTNHVHGTTVATFAPVARDLGSLSSRAFPRMAQALVSKIWDTMFYPVTKLRRLLLAYLRLTDSRLALPAPEVVPCPGYVEYSDKGASNPSFVKWYDGPDFQYGFTQAMPSPNIPSRYRVSDADIAVAKNTKELKSWAGEWSTSGDGSETVTEVNEDTPDSISVSVPDLDLTAGKFETPNRPSGNVYVIQGGGEEQPRRPPKWVDGPMKAQPYSVSEEATVLAKKIADSTVPLPKGKPALTIPISYTTLSIPRVPGRLSSNPKRDLVFGLKRFFPDAFIMNTNYAEDERAKLSFALTASTIRTAIDVSKMATARHERTYLPFLRSHVQPNYKSTAMNVLRTLIKRNMDTPYSMNPVGDETFYSLSRADIAAVYYREGAMDWLDHQDYMGPDEDAVREWVGKHDLQKTLKIIEEKKTFSFEDLMKGTNRPSLMLKGKAKAILDNSYASAVKLPQTVQYDQSGMHVPVLSSIIAGKVAREKHMLKPNILILQGKSPDDMSKFLRNYDWRSNDDGDLWYIEIDQAMFDKAQTGEIARAYVKRLLEFKVFPQYADFVDKETYHRFCSCVKAGVMVELDQQNPSGFAYTLDRNDDTTKIIMAPLLREIEKKIEFLIQQGDDILVAVRSHTKPNVDHWESVLNKRFNMNARVAVHNHGYACSWDLVHLPGGIIDISRCIIKESLSFSDMDLKDRDLLHEKWVSYCDRNQRIDNEYVHEYMKVGPMQRYRTVCPAVDSEAVSMICSALVTMLRSEDEFFSMFSDQLTYR